MNEGEKAAAQQGGPVADRRSVVLGGSASLAMLVIPEGRAGGGVAPSPAPGLDDCLSFFDTLALMRGRRPGDATAGWVRKWTAPVAVVLEGLVTAPACVGVAAALDELSHWSGVPFTLAREAAGGNTLTIRVAPQQVLTERYRHSGAVCMTSTFGHGGSLHAGRVEVGASHVDCLRHELMHALGFDNHWYGRGVAAAMPSVLALRHTAVRSESFSRWDALAVKVLYHPSLKPGMPRHMALPLARRVMAALDA